MRRVCSIVSFILFLLILLLILTNNITCFDNLVYNIVISNRSSFMDSFFRGITFFGNTIPIVCIIIFIFYRLDRERIPFIKCIVLSVLVNQIIKFIVRRPRPGHLILIGASGYSFPSGHAMVSLCVYGSIIYLVYKNINNIYLKVFLIICLFLLIVLIGISRIYLGVHYPSDVLAGYLLGFTIFERGILNEKNGCM